MQRGQAEYTRRVWARHAALALERAGETTLAATVRTHLGRWKQARRMLIDSGNLIGAAECCATAAASILATSDTTTTASSSTLLLWAAEAFKLYKSVHEYQKCLGLLTTIPGLSNQLKKASAARNDPADEVAHHLMLQAAASGDATAALAASRFVRNPEVRIKLLKQAGMWEEVAEALEDDAEAAEVLMEHVGYAAAVHRLLKSITSSSELETTTTTTPLPQQKSNLVLFSTTTKAAGARISEERSVRLLVQCTVALKDPKLLQQAFYLANGLPTGKKELPAAQLAVHIAEQMCNHDDNDDGSGISSSTNNTLFQVSRGVATSMVRDLTADVSQWRLKTATTTSSSSTSGPSKELCDQVQEMIIAAQLLLDDVDENENKHSKLAGALTLLALARLSSLTQESSTAPSPGTLIILRCLALLERTVGNSSSTTTTTTTTMDPLKSSPLLHFALSAALDALRWLHQGRQRSPDATALVNEFVHLYALSGFFNDAQLSGGLSVTNIWTQRSEDAWRTVTWPAHDVRFSQLLSRFKSEENLVPQQRPSESGQSGAIKDTEKKEEGEQGNSTSVAEVKRVLIWQLHHLLAPLAPGIYAAAMESSRESQTTYESPQLNSPNTTALMESFFDQLKVVHALEDGLSIAAAALNWLKNDSYSTVNGAEDLLWRAVLRITFPAAGFTAERAKTMVASFKNLFFVSGVDDQKLIAWVMSPFVTENDPGVLFREPAIAFTVWRVLSFVAPGEYRRTIFHRHLIMATKAVQVNSF